MQRSMVSALVASVQIVASERMSFHSASVYSSEGSSAVMSSFVPVSSIAEGSVPVFFPAGSFSLGNVKLDDKKMTFLLILYYCGLRRQEALALTPASFDWEKKTIRVREVLIF